MNRLLLLVVFVIFASTASAQTDKGTWLLGGNVNFSYSKNQSNSSLKNTAFEYKIAPNIGYFFFDQFAAGLKLSFDGSGYKPEFGDGFNSYETLNVVPFARYYLLPGQKQYNILVEGMYQYGFDGNFKRNTLAVNAGPVLYLNQAVGLEFLLGYSTTKFTKYDGWNKRLSLGIGLQVQLRKHK